jgi:hypothetical protein
MNFIVILSAFNGKKTTKLVLNSNYFFSGIPKPSHVFRENDDFEIQIYTSLGSSSHDI